MKVVKSSVANALTSAASDHILAVANDIYDESTEKYQSEINREALQSIEQAKSDIEEAKRNVEEAKRDVESVQALASNINDNINANIKEYLGALQQMATGYSFQTSAEEVFFNWESLPEKKKA